ncbi:tetratricopeptide repeat protein, partial [Candidatus Riflebacteria bacterium]
MKSKQKRLPITRREIFEAYEKGVDYFRDGRILEAFQLFRKVYNLEPDYRNVEYFLNVTEREKARIYNQLDHLVSEWTEPVELEFENKRQKINQAKTAFNQGNQRRCVELLNEYLFDNPDDIQVILLKIQAEKELGNFDQCFMELERLMSLAPGDIRPYKLGGNIYVIMGYYQDAKDLYLKALRFFPDSPDIFNNLGTLHMEIGLLEEAARYFERALEKNPKYKKAKNNLTAALKWIKFFDERIEKLKIDLEAHPEFADFHFKLAKAYQSRGYYDKARENYYAALDINPKYLEALFFLGETYEREGNFPEAKKAWMKLARLEGLLQNPLYLRALRLFDEGLNQEAIVQLRKVVEVEKDIAASHIKLGKSYYFDAKFTLAEAEFRKAILLKPNYP